MSYFQLWAVWSDGTVKNKNTIAGTFGSASIQRNTQVALCMRLPAGVSNVIWYSAGCLPRHVSLQVMNCGEMSATRRFQAGGKAEGSLDRLTGSPLVFLLRDVVFSCVFAPAARGSGSHNDILCPEIFSASLFSQ